MAPRKVKPFYSYEAAPQTTTQPSNVPRPVSARDLQRYQRQMGTLPVTGSFTSPSSSSSSSSRGGFSSATLTVPSASGSTSQSSGVSTRTSQDSLSAPAPAAVPPPIIAPVLVPVSSAPVPAPAPTVPTPIAPAPTLPVQAQPSAAAPLPQQGPNPPAPTATYPVAMEDVQSHCTPHYTWMDYGGDVVMLDVPGPQVPRHRPLYEGLWSAVLKRRKPNSRIPAAVIRMAKDEIARRRKFA
ncbi:hypothetical protein Dda_6677 [Drechslerella dactyloides]|uniref:Uncharacterized protein n=1 Tax=Drechslerella dactyloides TaxID=74499 RepID=A0AAD6ITZ1_DREDA|nr:hypothetical protein Dda_6677 [Drechslerella dactyloides]